MKTHAHTVQMGQNLTLIARRYGMTWRELYEHPVNVELRRLRPDANRIYVGDTVLIPAVNEGARRLGVFEVAP